MSAKFGNKINFKIVGKPPIEMFENNKSKFSNVSFDDVFTVEADSEIQLGEYTVDVSGNSFLFEIVKAKSKAFGKKYMAFAKGLNDFISKNEIDCGCIPCVKGNYLKFIK